MIEFLKHAFGFCGEHWHPNVFTFLFSGVASLPGVRYVYYRVKNRA